MFGNIDVVVCLSLFLGYVFHCFLQGVFIIVVFGVCLSQLPLGCMLHCCLWAVLRVCLLLLSSGCAYYCCLCNMLPLPVVFRVCLLLLLGRAGCCSLMTVTLKKAE